MSYQGSHPGGQNPPFLKLMTPSICQPGHPSSAFQLVLAANPRPQEPHLCVGWGGRDQAGQDPPGSWQPEGNGKAMGRGQVTPIFSGMLEARGTVDGKGRAAKGIL